MKVIIILSLVIASTQASTLNNRIVGGKTAIPGQFPYIVSLRQASRNSHFCGGTIIGNRSILTAAHCKEHEIEDTVVVVGTNKQNDKNARQYKVKSFTIHENYDSVTISNDIALIILTEDIIFDDLVKMTPLTNREIADDQRVTTAGWGWTSYPGNTPNDLLWMQTTVLSIAQCTRMTGNRYLRGKICTLEKRDVGACSGDSGGPLINDLNELVGVTSAVYKCARGMPDFFTDVYYFKDWIVAHASL